MSIPSPGHTDFGGGSFLRVASLLGDHDHRVSWGTSFNGTWAKAFRERLRALDLGVVDLHPMKGLGVHAPADTIVDGVTSLARYLDAEHIDLLVGERLCAAAGLAAQLTGIPWASVGTDGRQWSVVRSDTEKRLYEAIPDPPSVAEATDACRQLGIRPSEKCVLSDWLLSPFLNLSFLPEAFWYDSITQRGLRTHFVGGTHARSTAETGDETGRCRDDSPSTIALTLGNTFLPAAVNDIAALLPELMWLLPDCRMLLLSGSPRMTDLLRSICADVPRVTVTTWADYTDAFSRSCLAIGHGGTAYLWAAMDAGVPALILAPSQGDQRFNSSRVTQLGLGATLTRHELVAEKIAGAITRLLHDDDTRCRVRHFNELLHSGGGVIAAAELLERLSRSPKPIDACAGTKCCCTT